MRAVELRMMTIKLRTPLTSPASDKMGTIVGAEQSAAHRTVMYTAHEYVSFVVLVRRVASVLHR